MISLANLYINGRFATFDELKVKYGLPHSQFFSLSADQALYAICFSKLWIPAWRTWILWYTPDILSPSLYVNDQLWTDTTRIKDTWTEELGTELSESMWDEWLSKITSCSVNSTHQLIKDKIVHHLHYSKHKLHQLYPSVSPTCEKCKISETTLSHAFCFSPTLAAFWSRIFDFYSNAYKRLLQPEARLAIFGCPPAYEDLPISVQHSLELGILPVKRLILREWKSSTPPLFQRWITDMLSVIQIEKLRFIRTCP